MSYPGMPRDRIPRSTVPEVGGVGSPVGEAGGAALAVVGPVPGVRADMQGQATLGADGLVTVGTHLGFPLPLLRPAEGVAILELLMFLPIPKIPLHGDCHDLGRAPGALLLLDMRPL